MKQHEREYFIARIRSGIVRIKLENQTLIIYPLTLEQELEAQEIHLLAYRKAQEDGVLTQDEILENLRERGVWTEADDNKEKGLEKDIERLKVELFQNKSKSDLVKQIRIYLEAGKKQLNEIINKKHQYFDNSCEGMSQIEKVKKVISLSCYNQNGEIYDFEEYPIDYIMQLYGYQLLSEKTLRELARSEPWRSTWVLKDSNAYDLFANRGKQLTQDQRGLLVWSKMYDNVQESLDCPSDDVVEDDDMLDGWFILQKRKRDSERAKSDISKATSNSKISNASEIFVVANSKQDAEKINNANSIHAQNIKKQRAAVLEKRGEAVDLDFKDQQLRAVTQQNEMFKGKFRR